MKVKDILSINWFNWTIKVFCISSEERITISKQKKSLYLWKAVCDNFLWFLDHFSEVDPETHAHLRPLCGNEWAVN